MEWRRCLKVPAGLARACHCTHLPPALEVPTPSGGIAKLLTAKHDVRDGDDTAEHAHDEPDKAERDVPVAESALCRQQQGLLAAKAVRIVLMRHEELQPIARLEVLVEDAVELANRCARGCVRMHTPSPAA